MRRSAIAISSSDGGADEVDARSRRAARAAARSARSSEPIIAWKSPQRDARRAVVGEDDLPDVVDVLAARLIFTGGRRRPSWKTSVASPREAARRLAADLRQVPDVGDEGEELALVEDRLEQHVLGDVPGAAVRVVVEDDVARLERVDAELLERPRRR